MSKKLIFVVFLVITLSILFIYHFEIDNNTKAQVESKTNSTQSSPENNPIGIKGEKIVIEKPLSPDLIEMLMKEARNDANSDYDIDQEIFDEMTVLTERFNLERLESTNLSIQDKEIRIWMIEPTPQTLGFVVRYRNNKWNALRLEKKFNQENFNKINIEESKSNWEKWKEILSNKLLLSKVQNHKHLVPDPDSPLYVIEVKSGSNYAKNIYVSRDKTIKDNLLPNLCKKIEEDFNVNFCF